MKNKLWIRIGDDNDYHLFITLSGGISYLKRMDVGIFDHWSRYGLSTSRYFGHNYISLYWGDDKADGLKDLTASERKRVELALKC